MWRNLLLSGFAGVLLFSCTGCAVPKLPPEPEPKVVLGGDSVIKSDWLKDARLGEVSAIVMLPAAAEDKRVALACRNGILRASVAGAPAKFVPLSDPQAKLAFTSLTPEGFGGLVGSSVLSGSGVFDAQGKKLFAVTAMFGVDSVAAGDLDGDGKLEYVAGYNGFGGISRLDGSGKEVWNQGGGGNIWHVDCIDLDGKPGDEIVHTNAAGEFVALDGDGKHLRSSRPGEYCSHFSRCNWPDAAGAVHFVHAEENLVRVFDRQGASVAVFAAPECVMVSDVFATPLRLSAGAAPGFAALATGIKRSILYIFDDKQTLIYQEVLPDSASGIAAIPGSHGEEALLVGGENIIYKYALSSVPAPSA